jgi:hypothetical protein
MLRSKLEQAVVKSDEVEIEKIRKELEPYVLMDEEEAEMKKVSQL